MQSSEFFEKKYPSVKIVRIPITKFSPTIKLDDAAFDCFLTYINHSLELIEKFINTSSDGRGELYFLFCLLSRIASCAEGIYASEAEVVRNCNGDNSANLEIKLKITDDAILISHEGPTSCSREFTTVTKPRNISRSILMVSSM